MLIAGGVLLVLGVAGIGLALGLCISPSTTAATNATIVLSSTAGAAEHQGGYLGEFVEAGEHGGRPFYRQRDTEGQQGRFLYSEGGEWFVSDTLGGTSGGVMNSQNTNTPPSTQWEYYDGKKDNDDDTSLTLEFTTLSPICQLVRVAGEGEVVEKQGSSLGDYRSEYISVLIMQSQLSSSKCFQIERIDWTLQQQVGGRKVERGSAGLQESRRRDEVSSREGGNDCLEHPKLHN